MHARNRIQCHSANSWIASMTEFVYVLISEMGIWFIMFRNGQQFILLDFNLFRHKFRRKFKLSMFEAWLCLNVWTLMRIHVAICFTNTQQCLNWQKLNWGWPSNFISRGLYFNYSTIVRLEGWIGGFNSRGIRRLEWGFNSPSIKTQLIQTKRNTRHKFCT